MIVSEKSRELPARRGIFPVVEDDMDDPELLFTDERLYNDHDASEHAVEQFEAFARKGYVKEFGSLQELRDHLGEEPVLSELHVLERIKNGKVKRRIILDCKRTGLSRSSARAERTVLPRAMDVVSDLMAMAAASSHRRDMIAQMLVLDFVDAF